MTTVAKFNDAAVSPEDMGLLMLEELRKLPEECDYGRVRDMLARGASPDVYNDRGEWPLQACICYGHSEIGLLLVEKGAAVDFHAPDSQNTPLILAAHNGEVEIARALLEKGARIDHRGEKGKTAAEYAGSRHADAENTITQHPSLCDFTNPDPRVMVVKYAAIRTLITDAITSRNAAAEREAQRRQAENDWQAEGMPLRQALTIPRNTIKLKT
jgi:hypothetical protein